MAELINDLANATGIDPLRVQKVVQSAPRRYRDMVKDKPGGGERLISVPTQELKALQQALITILTPRVTVHPAATAYIKGASIKDNAAAHAGAHAIRNFDFEDFFPSLTAADWQRVCRQKDIFDDEDDLEVSTLILFKQCRTTSELQLAIGAPSSPMLSNMIMVPFDEAVAQMAASTGITYTRYVDDLTFSASSPELLAGVDLVISTALLAGQYANLRINDRKTRAAAKPEARLVTGLNLADNGTVTLGAERTATILTEIDGATRRPLTLRETMRINGLIAFANQIEPDFIVRLIDRYGAETVARIRGTSKAA